MHHHTIFDTPALDTVLRGLSLGSLRADGPLQAVLPSEGTRGKSAGQFEAG